MVNVFSYRMVSALTTRCRGRANKMSEFIEYFSARRPQMVDLLGELVKLESPTSSKTHVDAVGERLTALCTALGADVEVYPRAEVGDVRIAVWNGDAPGKPIMILTHLDTVWPVGTLERLPVREEDGRLYGPGVLDMKGGVVVSLEAIRGLRDRGEMPDRPIWIFFNSDEETGSVYTRDLIHEKAGQAGLVLVMEPATEDEAVKSWRKGIGRYTMNITGRASHSGNAPEAGINAVIEAAHEALYLHSLNDLPNGTSVSVTQMRGGVTINVIPQDAMVYADVRFLKASEADRVDQAIRAMIPTIPGAQLEIVGGIDRGPMERNAQMERVVAQAQTIGQSIGINVTEAGSGGASDGNFTAAMGIPTLDGMGPAGIGLHADHEHVIMSSLPRRAALMSAILRDWDMDAV